VAENYWEAVLNPDAGPNAKQKVSAEGPTLAEALAAAIAKAKGV